MNVRGKIAELLSDVQYLGGLEGKIADHLIANGVTVLEWIPVTERLPEHDFKVLVYGGDELLYVNGILQPTQCVYTGYLYDIDPEPCFFTWDKPQDVIKNVTHWMPIPRPPKGE